MAALLGHRLRGVTGGYILKRVDLPLVDAVNRVADHNDLLMREEAPPSAVVQFRPPRRLKKLPAVPLVARWYSLPRRTLQDRQTQRI